MKNRRFRLAAKAADRNLRLHRAAVLCTFFKLFRCLLDGEQFTDHRRRTFTPLDTELTFYVKRPRGAARHLRMGMLPLAGLGRPPRPQAGPGLTCAER